MGAATTNIFSLLVNLYKGLVYIYICMYISWGEEELDIVIGPKW